MAQHHVWIGLAEITPSDEDNEVLEKGVGAYVNALAFAEDEINFRHQVDEAIKGLSLQMEALDDVEKFSDRSAKYILSEDLKKLAQEAEILNTVVFGTFHTYIDE